MAEVQIQVVPFNGEGHIYRWEGLVPGDTAKELVLNDAQVELTVHVYGTFGGATIEIHGSVARGVFTAVHDAFGNLLNAITAVSIRPIGPVITAIKPLITGGVASDIDVDLYVVRKVR